MLHRDKGAHFGISDCSACDPSQLQTFLTRDPSSLRCSALFMRMSSGTVKSVPETEKHYVNCILSPHTHTRHCPTPPKPVKLVKERSFYAVLFVVEGSVSTASNPPIRVASSGCSEMTILFERKLYIDD